MRFSVLRYRKKPPSLRDKEVFWRVPVEFRGLVYNRKKPPNCVRIACLGDSTTEGRTGNMPADKTYPAFLKKRLSAIFPEKKFEVMNCGIRGYSSLQVRRYLKKEIWSYHPDVVIVWAGIHDPCRAWAYADKDQKLPLPGPGNILAHSHLFLFLRNYRQIIATEHSGLVRVSPRDSAENFRDIAVSAPRHNARTVFIVPFLVDRKKNRVSYVFQGAYEDSFDPASAAAQCAVIDPVPWLKKQDDLKDLFFDTCHPTAKGTRLLAGYIAEKLIKLKILPLTQKKNENHTG